MAASAERPAGPTLPAGTLLGPHEILEPIGAGGMGEVHRAPATLTLQDVAPDGALLVAPPVRLGRHLSDLFLARGIR